MNVKKELISRYGEQMTISQVEEVLGKFRHTLKDYTTYGGTLTEVTHPDTVVAWLSGAGHSRKLITAILKSA